MLCDRRTRAPRVATTWPHLAGRKAGNQQESQMAIIIGSKFKDLLVGTSTDDTIFDMDGNDTIIAGGGNDTIFAGKGGDFISGGDGVDTLYYGTSDKAVNVNLATHVGHGGFAE